MSLAIPIIGFPLGVKGFRVVKWTSAGSYTYTFDKPALLLLVAVGGGGGGGGGGGSATASYYGGGGGGGGSGEVLIFPTFVRRGTTLSISVGAGGTGGAGGTTAPSNGSPGAAGGDTIVKSGDFTLVAKGGGGGSGGIAASSSASGSGGDAGKTYSPRYVSWLYTAQFTSAGSSLTLDWPFSGTLKLIQAIAQSAKGATPNGGAGGYVAFPTDFFPPTAGGAGGGAGANGGDGQGCGAGGGGGGGGLNSAGGNGGKGADGCVVMFIWELE